MQIRQPRALAALRGEIPIAVQPRLAGRVDAGEQRRMNAFAGRALTAPLLHAEQNHRSRRIALLNRALSAGVVEGLGLAFFDVDMAPIGSAADPAPAELDLAAPRRVQIDSGVALDASGEEVVVPQPVHFDALDLPVRAPSWLLDGEDPPERDRRSRRQRARKPPAGPQPARRAARRPCVAACRSGAARTGRTLAGRRRRPLRPV